MGDLQLDSLVAQTGKVHVLEAALWRDAGRERVKAGEPENSCLAAKEVEGALEITERPGMNSHLSDLQRGGVVYSRACGKLEVDPKPQCGLSDALYGILLGEKTYVR